MIVTDADHKKEVFVINSGRCLENPFWHDVTRLNRLSSYKLDIVSFILIFNSAKLMETSDRYCVDFTC